MRDFGFAERAVERCVDAMQKQCVSPQHVNAVIKYDNVDVKPIEPFLQDEDENVRKMAVQIIGTRGDVSKIIELSKTEKNKNILMLIMSFLTKKKDGIEGLVDLLSSTDESIRVEAINMFKRSGRSDCLVGLLFDDDDDFVERIKSYIEKAEADELQS